MKGKDAASSARHRSVARARYSSRLTSPEMTSAGGSCPMSAAVPMTKPTTAEVA